MVTVKSVCVNRYRKKRKKRVKTKKKGKRVLKVVKCLEFVSLFVFLNIYHGKKLKYIFVSVSGEEGRGRGRLDFLPYQLET